MVRRIVLPDISRPIYTIQILNKVSRYAASFYGVINLLILEDPLYILEAVQSYGA